MRGTELVVSADDESRRRRVTVLVTGAVFLLCTLIRRHYDTVSRNLRKLYASMEELPVGHKGPVPAVDTKVIKAAVFVSSYGGVGIHTVLNVFRQFPGHYKNIVFLSVGVVDSGNFKGEGAIEGLKARTAENLAKYLGLAAELGVPACARPTVGTDVVAEAEGLCAEIFRELPKTTVFLGKLVLPGGGSFLLLFH